MTELQTQAWMADRNLTKVNHKSETGKNPRLLCVESVSVDCISAKFYHKDEMLRRTHKKNQKKNLNWLIYTVLDDVISYFLICDTSQS